MTSELFTLSGERKYLTEAERDAFIAAATAHERGEVRTFGLVLAYTGARICKTPLHRRQAFHTFFYA